MHLRQYSFPHLNRIHVFKDAWTNVIDCNAVVFSIVYYAEGLSEHAALLTLLNLQTVYENIKYKIGTILSLIHRSA